MPSPLDPRLIPKAELHVHIEGTLEPAMAFALAERNGVTLPFENVAALRQAYRFADLASFLQLYYACSAALRTERDFYDLTAAYLARAHADGVKHAELFFDPQTHLARGVSFGTILTGISKAVDAQSAVTCGLILCFLRDVPAADAERVLDLALPYRERLVAVGLDSAEAGNPPGRFKTVFARAREAGLLTVAHAGEEGPPEYITEALDALGASRIDHGVRCLESPAVVDRLRREQTPLTVCPFSNVKLGVVDSLATHPIRTLVAEGLLVTVNSDDPAYFGGYVADNYAGVRDACGWGDAELVVLARNSFKASFLAPSLRETYLTSLLPFHNEVRAAVPGGSAARP